MNRTATRFSIIIPVCGQPSALDDTLASILRDVADDSEVLLVHDGTFEDPYGIGEELTIINAQSKRLSVQLAQAVERCSGELIALVRPGIELPEQWETIVSEAFADPSVGSVTPLLVSKSKPDTIVTAGIRTNYFYRRLLTGMGRKASPRVVSKLRPIGPSSWAGFYRRSTLNMIVDQNQKLEDAYLDLDLALYLKQLGCTSLFLPQCVCQAERPAVVAREAQLPHGASAQRSITRHAQGGSTLARSLTSFFGELTAAIIKPGAFNQAIGRFGARRFGADDAKFALRISELARRDENMEASGLQVFEEESLADAQDALSGTAEFKRAA